MKNYLYFVGLNSRLGQSSFSRLVAPRRLFRCEGLIWKNIFYMLAKAQTQRTSKF